MTERISAAVEEGGDGTHDDHDGRYARDDDHPPNADFRRISLPCT